MKNFIQIQRMVLSVSILVCLLLSPFSMDNAWGAEGDSKQVTMKVEGMTCASCPATIRAALKRLPGVVKVKVSYKKEKATVSYQDGNVTVEQMIRAIEDLGYRASPME